MWFPKKSPLPPNLSTDAKMPPDTPPYAAKCFGVANKLCSAVLSDCDFNMAVPWSHQLPTLNQTSMTWGVSSCRSFRFSIGGSVAFFFGTWIWDVPQTQICSSLRRQSAHLPFQMKGIDFSGTQNSQWWILNSFVLLKFLSYPTKREGFPQTHLITTTFLGGDHSELPHIQWMIFQFQNSLGTLFWKKTTYIVSSINQQVMTFSTRKCPWVQYYNYQLPTERWSFWKTILFNFWLSLLFVAYTSQLPSLKLT